MNAPASVNIDQHQDENLMSVKEPVKSMKSDDNTSDGPFSVEKSSSESTGDKATLAGEADNESVGIAENIAAPKTVEDDINDAVPPSIDEKVDDSEVPDKKDANDKKCNDLPSPEAEEDEEVRLAMEMAMAAAKNPHLSPLEIQKLVGEKNAQAKMIDEFAKQNEEKIKRNQAKVKELQRQRSNVESTNTTSVATSWWTIAAKKAEEMKERAERSLYAEQISNDEKIIEIRKSMKVLKKTLKAHRLQGNRVETRHAFKRQRMEKRLFQSAEKLKKTQDVFTNSSYNVQEYLKAMMRASKKWRKIGTDDELLLEAQLSRNMHQMLALEKQKVKCKKNTKELKKYLQRCKGWLSDKKAFCEMNIMTIDATQNSIMRLYEETLRRQDRLIEKCKSSEEFKNVDLSGVDLSHVTMPILSYDTKPTPTKESESDALRGLPIVDSIRKKKGFIDSSYHSRKEEENDHVETNDGERISRKELLEMYYKSKERAEQQASNTTAPELYVVANKDDESVSSRLSDPDGSNNYDLDDQKGGVNDDDSDDDEFGNDAPWNVANRNRVSSTDSALSESVKVPAD